MHAATQASASAHFMSHPSSTPPSTPFAPLPTFAAAAPASTPLRRRDDVQVVALIDGFAARGGLASGDEITHLMRASWRQPISALARWIVARKVLSFSWRGQLLLPLFQFHLPRVAPLDGVVESAAELLDLFDDQGLAEWFLRPCVWLDHAVPADVVLNDADAVISAARATRFAAGLSSRRCRTGGAS